MKKRLIGLALALAVATGASGCFSASFTTRQMPSQRHVLWHNFFIIGLAGEAVVDGRYLCPNGVSAVRHYMSPVQGVLTLVTVGIWTPRTTVIDCAAGGGPR